VQQLSVENEINPNLLTKIVIVGDYNQLPPVQPVPPPKNLEGILKSLFVFYVKTHEIPNTQLQVNYRSNKDIVDFTSLLGFYKNLKPDIRNENSLLLGNIENIEEKWVKQVLDPQKVVTSIIHNEKYEIGVSALEAFLVVQIILGYFKMANPTSRVQEINFWRNQVGVVAPHNAQGRLIIRELYDTLTDPSKPLTNLNHARLMSLLKDTVYSVEKFQGSDRELIISSIGISDRDQLRAESEFIYNINRFNVLTSRAKSKIILIASKRFFKFIPKERSIMEEAAHIRNYALNYCDKSEKILIKDEKNLDRVVEFRYKD
jgi:superfamily I DNA and/or RNA helicase